MSLCRIEYLSQRGWWTGHKGVELKDPARYATGVNTRLPTRVTDLDTGDVYGVAAVEPCVHCEEQHAPPHDGRCLL